MDFNTFAAIKESGSTSTANRPVKQIRAGLKAEALNLALETAFRHIVDTEGLILGDHHYDLTQEDRVFAIRTAFNAIHGPALSYDKESAQQAYEMLASNEDKPTEGK